MERVPWRVTTHPWFAISQSLQLSALIQIEHLLWNDWLRLSETLASIFTHTLLFHYLYALIELSLYLTTVANNVPLSWLQIWNLYKWFNYTSVRLLPSAKMYFCGISRKWLNALFAYSRSLPTRFLRVAGYIFIKTWMGKGLLKPAFCSSLQLPPLLQHSKSRGTRISSQAFHLPFNYREIKWTDFNTSLCPISDHGRFHCCSEGEKEKHVGMKWLGKWCQ